MEFQHTSVLLSEAVDGLNCRRDGVYVDGTLGGAGHAAEICRRLGESGMLVGIDRDRDALEAAGKVLEGFSCKRVYVKDNFSNIKSIVAQLGLQGIDGAILDLGVSSFQLDNPERGFSYMQDSPLDMRMDQQAEKTAEEVVNTYSREALAAIIRDYGEERWASRIAEFIVRARIRERIVTTGRLVEIIKAAVPSSARRDGPHPAKRTFQAIRIEVNDELSLLRGAVTALIDVLNKNGRLAIITFHSLEDRIVKEIFQGETQPCTCPPDLPVCVCGKVPRIRKITRKPILPSEREVGENPRARSAKLRIIERL